MRYTIEYYFTLQEIFETWPYSPSDNVSLASLVTGDPFNFTYTTNTIIEQLWQKIINTFGDLPIIKSDKEEPSSEEMGLKLVNWLTRVLNTIEETRMRHETLIGIMNSELSNLMEDVKAETTNEVLFNDVPQTISGEFQGDGYASTYTKTKSETKSPTKTKIKRIKDIQDNLRDAWKDWLDCFRNLFYTQMEGSYYEE